MATEPKPQLPDEIRKQLEPFREQLRTSPPSEVHGRISASLAPKRSTSKSLWRILLGLVLIGVTLAGVGFVGFAAIMGTQRARAAYHNLLAHLEVLGTQQGAMATEIAALSVPSSTPASVFTPTPTPSFEITVSFSPETPISGQAFMVFVDVHTADGRSPSDGVKVSLSASSDLITFNPSSPTLNGGRAQANALAGMADAATEITITARLDDNTTGEANLTLQPLAPTIPPTPVKMKIAGGAGAPLYREDDPTAVILTRLVDNIEVEFLAEIEIAAQKYDKVIVEGWVRESIITPEDSDKIKPTEANALSLGEPGKEYLAFFGPGAINGLTIARTGATITIAEGTARDGTYVRIRIIGLISSGRLKSP